MNDFSICFNSIHLPIMPALNSLDVSHEGKKILETLYNSLNTEMRSARVPELVAKSLDKSIFACCIPDGFAILRCSVNNQMKVFLRGFLLRKDESLRTAWLTARWQILWLCAMEDWKEYGKVYMSLDEIDRKVSHASFSPEYYNDLSNIFQQMNSSEVPFSFALTSYQVRKLPFDFSRNVTMHVNNGENIDFSNSINIDNYISRRRQEIDSKFRNVSMWLECITQKQYLNAIEKMSIDPKNAKSNRADAKEKLTSYSTNNKLWCFRYCDNETVYCELVPYSMYQNLLNGSVLFSDIVIRNEGHIRNNALKYAECKRQYAEQCELKKAEEMKAQKQKAEKNGDDAETKQSFRKKIEEKGLKGLFHRK